MDNETKYLLAVVKALLHHTEPAFPADCTVDYTRLFAIAKRNSIANMAAFYFEKKAEIPEEIRKKFSMELHKIIAQQVQCSAVVDEVGKLMKTNQIRGIVLKGTLLKALYPNPYMRSMSDIDIFAEQSSIDQICDLMPGLGYQPGTIGTGNHYEFLKYKIAKVEFHPELVALDSAYGKSVFSPLNAGSVADSMDIWSHTVPYHDNEYLRQLTPEYHYVYVIMHMMNHFLGAGTGIRSLVDVWVMNHHYSESWDRDIIDRELQKSGLAKFEKYAVALADRWFELPVCLNEEVEGTTLDLFEKYILSSGTYGNTEHKVVAKMGGDLSMASKLGFLLSSWFLPMRAMKGQYPVLEKAPVLLPAMWLYRLYDVFHNRGNAAKKKLSTVAELKNDAADDMKTLFENVI